MNETYNTLFNRYLAACKSKYDINHPYDNLDECCDFTKRIKYELLGMVNLMEEMGVITQEQSEKEWGRIIKIFSTHDLFNCYKEDNGIVMMWRKTR